MLLKSQDSILPSVAPYSAPVTEKKVAPCDTIIRKFDCIDKKLH